MSSRAIYAQAAELAGARGVARAMLIDANSFKHEAEGFECKCGQHLL